MSTISGHVDLNTDAVLVDRQNEVAVFDSSETNACGIVPASVDNGVKVRDHDFCRVGDSLGVNESVKPGYDELSCGTGREGFDKDTEVMQRANDMEVGAELLRGVFRADKCLDSALNYGVVNDVEYGDESGVTDNGLTSIEFKLNKEAQAEENQIICRNAGKNAKDFGDEGNGSERKCHVDELADQGAIKVMGDENNVNAAHVADQGAIKVMGDENNVNAAHDKVSTDGPNHHCASRTSESVCQSLDGVLHMEAKDVNFKESLHHEFPISRNHLCQVETSHPLKEPSHEVCAQPEALKSQTMDINLTEVLPLGNIQNECHGLNLVVDFNSCRKLVQIDMNMKSLSSEFRVSDLVWGKVRGHPWWPGQIFDPSAASEKAKRYFKKDSYLIAYFGDQSFSWNDASKIKPFQMYFSQMEKQSDLDNFYHAVDCALDEISRRVELGLSCPCTPEVLTNLKTQIITNAGIQEHSSRRDGGDRFLNAITFEPKKLVNFVQLLAESPLVEFDRLDLAIARAQFLAFRNSKGYSQLPEFVANDALVKDDTEIITMDVEEKGQYDDQIDSQGLETDIGYSPKRKHISGRDCVWPCKKQKRLSDLMSEKSLRLPNDEHALGGEADGDESILFSSTWKAYENTSDDDCHKSRNIILIQLHEVSVDEMWWQLRLAARDPTRDGCFTVMVNFFAEFRNFSSPHYSTLMELCNDSYWTDRIIQSIPEEQSSLEKQNEREEFLPVNPAEGVAPSFKPQAGVDGKERFDENSKEGTCPAALILEFTNLDSIPSETSLNKIFGRFGPLIESQTKLLKRSRRAKVVFKRLSDAESAFSSAGKYGTFGPSLFRYHLKVMPSSSKAPVGAGKRGRKRSSGEGGEV
ncbi:uncharacterized protein LOC114749095 [Neltuma alba]|uniref:uncharacterized protein LOC114732808 n=1 Tax=Neltuma alba TaxID=207710 RepID=UPI0010A58E14|nr:uncharacterized protein LOC114732808 [Prosopis alba]XP_028793403.1 uncharacterized protein LOC114749095 [Prosopis alba]